MENFKKRLYMHFDDCKSHVNPIETEQAHEIEQYAPLVFDDGHL